MEWAFMVFEIFSRSLFSGLLFSKTPCILVVSIRCLRPSLALIWFFGTASLVQFFKTIEIYWSHWSQCVELCESTIMAIKYFTLLLKCCLGLFIFLPIMLDWRRINFQNQDGNKIKKCFIVISIINDLLPMLLSHFELLWSFPFRHDRGNKVIDDLSCFAIDLNIISHSIK